MWAQVCEKSLRNSDIVGRLGGEEFSVILPETDLAQAQAFADRLCQTIAHTPCQLPGDQTAVVTVSIGVSQFESDDHNETDILGRADKAMYFSKTQGKKPGECLSSRLS